MKFSCDDCGAQYMIADDKIGPRGVKVRCKKCTHVIVLRPDGHDEVSVGVSAPQPSRAIPSGPPPAPECDRSDERTLAIEASASNGAVDAPSASELHETSSEFGLSVEFAARGFDEPSSDGWRRGRSPTLNVGLDVARVQPIEGPSSPFTRRIATGGSLDEVDLSAEENPAMATRVDARPYSSSDGGAEHDPFAEPETSVGPLPAAFDRRGHFDEADDEGVEVDIEAPIDPSCAAGDSAGLSLVPSVSPHDRPRASLVSALSEEATDGHAGGDSSDASDWAHEDVGDSGDLRSSEPSWGSGSVESQIGQAFDAVFGGGEGNPFDALVASGASRAVEANDSVLPTRPFVTESNPQVAQEPQIVPPRASAPEPREWYVAISDEQVGPLVRSEVEQHWDAKQIGPNSLCWKPGMADWIAIRFVKELGALGSMDEGRRAGAPPAVKPEESRRAYDPLPEIAVEVTPPQALSVGAEWALESAPVDMSEPSWRPNAASALASLAREALDGNEVTPEPQSPLRRSRGPTGGSVISALLDEGRTRGTEGRAAAALFGAAELSSSRVMRPLPKSSDVASSIPLRDPVENRSRSTVVPTIIVGALAIASAVGAAWFFTRPAAAPAAPPVADAPLPARLAPAAAGTAANPIEALAPTPEPAAALGAEPEAPARGSAVAVNPDEPAGAAAAAGSGAKPGTEPASAESNPPRSASALAAGHKGKPTKKTPARAEPPRRTDPPPPARAAVAERQDPPPAPPPSAQTSADLSAGDLLAGAGRRPSEEARPEVPETLSDAQILGVLRKHKGAINACRDRQTEADPAIEGVMTVKLLIKNDGRTANHLVSPDRFSGTIVGNCILESVRGWIFPKFSGPAQPLDFPVKVRSRP